MSPAKRKKKTTTKKKAPPSKGEKRSPPAAAVASGRFRVEIPGVPAFGFLAATGLAGRSRYLELEEGGVEQPRLFIEGTIWEPLRLERVHDGSAQLLDWFRSGDPRDGDGRLQRRRGRTAVPAHQMDRAAA